MCYICRNLFLSQIILKHILNYLRLLLAALVFLVPMQGKAQEAAPVWSVLTCSPGTQSYSLYGHTALRMRQGTTDVVFNYGVFNFDTPHFVWRFVLGQTDYMVVGVDKDIFLEEYIHQGREVSEQVLNLTDEESLRLLDYMLWDVQPDNRVYRYNFLTNNCATRVLDAVLDAVNRPGTEVVERMKPGNLPTYRELLHGYTQHYAWNQEGNDLLLGYACDTLLTCRAAAFLPREMAQYMDSLVVWSQHDDLRPLVLSKNILLPLRAAVPKVQPFWQRPLAVGLLFVALMLLTFYAEHRWQRRLWLLDAVLMTVQGVAGLLVLFMLLVSEHPTVDGNFQAFVLNPLPLVCMPWVVSKARQKRFCLYHPLNLVYLLVFLLLSVWIPQDFAEIIVPLAFGLALREASYVINKEK